MSEKAYEVERRKSLDLAAAGAAVIAANRATATPGMALVADAVTSSSPADKTDDEKSELAKELAELRRLSRCEQAESAAVQIAGAVETESPICCSSCLAGTGGSRSQLLFMRHAFLLKFALYKLDRSMLLHQLHAQ